MKHSNFVEYLSREVENVRAHARRNVQYDWRHQDVVGSRFLGAMKEFSIKHMKGSDQGFGGRKESIDVPFWLAKLLARRYHYWIHKGDLTPAEMNAVAKKLIEFLCPCIEKDPMAEFVSKRALRRKAGKFGVREMRE